jgi:hypothetical protein
MHWVEALNKSNVGLATATVNHKDGSRTIFTRSYCTCDKTRMQGFYHIGTRHAQPSEYEGLDNWEPVIK